MLSWLKKYVAVIHTDVQDVWLLQASNHCIGINPKIIDIMKLGRSSVRFSYRYAFLAFE
jgi:hypothetical protein